MMQEVRFEFEDQDRSKIIENFINAGRFFKNHKDMKENYENSQYEFKRVFDFESAKAKPLISVNFKEDIAMLAHKFKLLNYGFEWQFEIADEIQKGTMVDRKKAIPDGNIKRIPQTRKFRIPRWQSRTIAEYDVENKYWISNNIKIDLPFFPFSSIAYAPNKDIYVTGGLNDIIASDNTTFSSRCSRVRETALNFIESRYDVKEMEVMWLKWGCHATVFLEDMLYAIGGQHTPDRILKRCEVFNIAKNTWDLIPQMEFKRKYPVAIALNPSAIYVFGGCIRDEVDEDWIECYNPKKKEWKVLQLFLPTFYKQLTAFWANK
jgi:hypothetical protein